MNNELMTERRVNGERTAFGGTGLRGKETSYCRQTIIYITMLGVIPILAFTSCATGVESTNFSSVNLLQVFPMEAQPEVGVVSVFGEPGYLGRARSLPATIMANIMPPRNKDSVKVTFADLQRSNLPAMFTNRISAYLNTQTISVDEYIHKEDSDGNLATDYIETAKSAGFDWVLVFYTDLWIYPVDGVLPNVLLLRPEVVVSGSLYRVSDGTLLWRGIGKGIAERDLDDDIDDCDLILFDNGERQLIGCAQIAIGSVATKLENTSLRNKSAIPDPSQIILRRH